ncbi:hypothetical protein BLOT_002119 [Blomia tropicalis]|nr:hypothetical protein BLOT_002119 [Blomia tropicalis]
MRVPEKIKLSNNHSSSDVLEDPAIVAVKKVNDNSEWMRVPERICVVGGETHISTRQPPPEMKLEHTFLGKPSTEYDKMVQLTTPPRTLRIEDTTPTFDEPLNKLDKALKSVDRTMNRSFDSRMNDSLMEFEDSEMTSHNYIQIRRRFVQISQRLDTLEIESSRRSKRDMILYTIGFLYILFRGVNWFSGRNEFRL